ncbi:glycosyltransferase family 2 protein [Vibrio cholerae]
MIIEEYIFLPMYIIISFLLFLSPWLFYIKKSSHKVVSDKNICIVIPTYNDGLNLIKTLDSIEHISTKNNVEVILVDDASSDNTKLYFDLWCKNEKRRFSYTYVNTGINTGLKSKAVSFSIPYIDVLNDSVVIIDGDTILTKDALDIAITELYSDSSIGAVCGAVLPLKEQRSNIVDFLQYFELVGAFHGIKLAQSNMDSTASLAGAFTIHKIEALNDVGWFDGWLVEDICWTWKARAKGWKLIYSPNSIAYTLCPINLKDLWRQRTRWSRGRVEALKVAFAEKNVRFLKVIPWFLYSVIQAVWIPVFVIALVINPEKTIFLYAIIFILHCIFAWANINRNNICRYSILQSFYSAIWTSFLVDLILFVPNVKGLLLESLGARKRWLTR